MLGLLTSKSHSWLFVYLHVHSERVNILWAQVFCTILEKHWFYNKGLGQAPSTAVGNKLTPRGERATPDPVGAIWWRRYVYASESWKQTEKRHVAHRYSMCQVCKAPWSINTHTHMHAHTHTYARTHTHTHAHTHTRMHTHTHTHATHTHTCMYTHAHTHMRTHTHTCIHTLKHS